MVSIYKGRLKNELTPISGCFSFSDDLLSFVLAKLAALVLAKLAALVLAKLAALVLAKLAALVLAKLASLVFRRPFRFFY